MREPNLHDWNSLFDGNICRICSWHCGNGTAKENHAKKHERSNRVRRVGKGTKQAPYEYEIV